MLRRLITLIKQLAIVVFFMWLGLSPVLGNVRATNALAPPILSSPMAAITLSPYPTYSATLNNSNTNSSITLFNTLLDGLVGAIITTLVALGIAIYQIRRNKKSEQEKLAIQIELERERIRYQDEIRASRAAQEREIQRKEAEAEAVQLASRRAKTVEEYAQAYCNALRTDPHITHLQILDMSHSLEIKRVYVQVRLHQEARLGYALDPDLLDAEARRDPNVLLHASRRYLENRISVALAPDEVIRTYRRCVIVGDPGAGKTTLLKFLVLKSVNNELPGLPALPIYIELNGFVSSGHLDLLDYASGRWDERYGFPKTEARHYIEENLKAGNVLLLLDALDETVIGNSAEEAEASYRRVANAIMQLATRYYNSPIVVTARKAGYQQRTLLKGFTELEVLEFRPQDIQLFVNNWFACYPKLQKRSSATDLNTKLERNPRIQALAANPLLLSLIVIVYEAQLDLPDRRAELYKQCVETLLTKWDASRDIRRRREFKPEHKLQLLEEVAWHFHIQGRRYFPESELLTVIANFLPAVGLPAEQNGRVLEEIANENGLLKEQARGWHGFLHLTLQEFFVAQQIADQNKLDTLLEHRGDPWWEEVLLLYAGRTPDASPLLHKLLGHGDRRPFRDDVFHTNVILAGHCLAARPTIRQPSLREEVTSFLFEILKKTSYSLTRLQIADTLAEIGGKEVNTQLLRLLSDPQIDAPVRRSIAEALGKLGERSVAFDLLQMLSDSRIDAPVRRSIAEALGKLGERSVAFDLLQMLVNRQVELYVRMRIAEALGALGDQSVVPELLQVLSDPQSDSLLCEHIANALGTLGEPSIAPALLQILSNPQIHQNVCRSIAETLGKLGEKSVVPKLLQLLSDSQIDLFIRQSIADALGMLGERSVIPVLLQLLSDSQINRDVGKSIAVALGKLGEKSVASDLLQVLSDQQIDPFVRRSIAQTLGVLGERSVVPTLLERFANLKADLLVKPSIAVTLATLGERSVVAFLLEYLSDQHIDQDTHIRIVDALGALGERSVLPTLLQYLINPKIERSIRRNIAGALGVLGEHSVIPRLLSLISNPQIPRDIREQIIDSIGQLADDEVTAHALASQLQMSDMTNAIHKAMWKVSQRAGVRIFMTDGQTGQQIEIAKFGNEP